MVTISGLAMLAFVAWRHAELLKFSPKAIHICLGYSLGICLLTGLPSLFFAGSDMVETSILAAVPLWRILAAGLEDALFVLPAFLIPKPYRYGFLAFSSVAFMFGHAYQGAAMWGKALSVPVVYLLAARYGILTTMVAHGLQDLGAMSILHALLRFVPAR